jgi:hypothetical protein
MFDALRTLQCRQQGACFSGAFREGGAKTRPEYWNFNDSSRFAEQASNE